MPSSREALQKSRASTVNETRQEIATLLSSRLSRAKPKISVGAPPASVPASTPISNDIITKSLAIRDQMPRSSERRYLAADQAKKGNIVFGKIAQLQRRSEQTQDLMTRAGYARRAVNPSQSPSKVKRGEAGTRPVALNYFPAGEHLAPAAHLSESPSSAIYQFIHPQTRGPTMDGGRAKRSARAHVGGRHLPER